MHFLRTIQLAIIAAAAVLFVFSSALSQAISFIFNNLLRFNPNGHDAKVEPVLLFIALGVFALLLGIEAIRVGIHRRRTNLVKSPSTPSDS